MTDIIKVLPDAIANQIAAGEVVQRPSSVVKELMDNSLDAGSTKVIVSIENAGKSLIRVIDNGKGMSLTDARMAFERHATSKINKAEDLFSIRSMGFRGEALASIAAVANVSLKTRQAGEDLGTHLNISVSEVIKQEQASCSEGTDFTVQNLFFNIPARRKFLKTNATELRHIIIQFQRLALAHPEVHFQLLHDNKEIYQLLKTNLKQRIVNIFGGNIQAQLISIESSTSYARLKGYIGKPEKAKRKFGEQFFFVNNRYIRHSYLHKAVMEAYGQLLPSSMVPSYFIFIDVSPDLIDVNIHPTKTEVKFDDERTLFQIVLATVKEGLGKYNIVPSIDFEADRGFEIPVSNADQPVKEPEISHNPEYNPFNSNPSSIYTNYKPDDKNKAPEGWARLYEFDDVEEQTEQQQTLTDEHIVAIGMFQVKGKYIFSKAKSGIMVIHQQRAHERILFDQLMQVSNQQPINTQRLLFPNIVTLSITEMNIFGEIADDLQALGFEIDLLGKDTISITGVPGGIKIENIEQFIEDLLANYHNKEILGAQLTENIVKILAKSAAVSRPKKISQEEMQQLIDTLFSCNTPSHTADGKKIIQIIPIETIDNYFNKI